MQEFLLRIAASVIRKADRAHPADAALRTELKNQRDLVPDQRRAIARAVFCFYRWSKWVEQGSVTEQILRALQLQERFIRQPGSFTDEELASKAVPPWIREEMTVSREFLRALQSEPRLWLRARPGCRSELARKLGDCRPVASLVDSLEYVGQKDLFRTPEFHAGEFEIQDISSQLVGLICAPKPGETWWDACAGEGGKTLHLSDLMRNQGLIWSSDRAEWRLRLLKRRAARARIFNYRTAVWPSGRNPPMKTKFDGVLLDAPCSGVGTWQRNPHARWTTGSEDVKELAESQSQLLAQTAGTLKPGGKLIYAVCTLTRRETTEVVREFERKFPECQPLPLRNPLRPESPAATPLWIFPHELGGNGMFVATWRKVSDSVRA